MRIAPSEHRALAGFRHALRRFLAFSSAAARGAGLSPQQHQALLAIVGHAGPAPIGLGELAARLQVRPHSAVGLVDRLAERGLVRRAPDPRDRRRVRLRLTARGEAAIRALSAAHRDELRRLRPELERWLRELGRP